MARQTGQHQGLAILVYLLLVVPEIRVQAKVEFVHPQDGDRRIMGRRAKDGEHPVIFDQHGYSVDLPENTEPFKEILQVHATVSADVDIVRYRLVFADDFYNKFAVDPSTGVITVTETFDYDLSWDKFLFFFVCVKSTCVSVGVTITDENDNFPSIIPHGFAEGEVVVSESAGVGSSVLQVSVVDRDSGLNGEVTCELHDEGGRDHFALEEETLGEFVVVTTVRLDEETQPDLYRLMIICSDRGEPPNAAMEQFELRVNRLKTL